MLKKIVEILYKILTIILIALAIAGLIVFCIPMNLLYLVNPKAFEKFVGSKKIRILL